MLLVKVDDPTGRADQNIDARLEVSTLFVVVHTTKGEAKGQACVLAQQLRIAMDLYREFTRWGQNEAPRGGERSVCRRRIAQQLCEHGD